jgi:hypothetical protein
MIEARGDIASDFWFLHHLCPVEREVVIIEYVLPLLGIKVAGEQFFEFAFPIGAPSKIRP